MARKIRQSGVTWTFSLLPIRQQQVTPGCHTGVVMVHEGGWREPVVQATPSVVTMRHGGHVSSCRRITKCTNN